MQEVIGLERLDDGPMRVGSEWRETRKMYGKEASEHFDVVELDEPDKIVLRCDGTKGTMGKGLFEFTALAFLNDDILAAEGVSTESGIDIKNILNKIK